MTRPRVVIELVGDSGQARDLAFGGAFVPGLELPELAECELVVKCEDRELALDARVVMVNGTGVALEVVGFSQATRVRIAEVAGGGAAATSMRNHRPSTPPPVSRTITPITLPAPPPVPAADPGPALELEAPDAPVAAEPREELLDLESGPVRKSSRASGPALALDLSLEPEVAAPRIGAAFDLDAEAVATTFDLEGEGEPAAEDEAAAASDAEAETETETETGTETETAKQTETDERSFRAIPLNVHERVRGLNLQQQMKLAITGEVSERIILERLYGKTVWEHLLRNPRITGPEVARIARMGQLPRPLIEQIVNHGGWLQIPEVRRSLLTNPRLGVDQILRVLRLLPKHELKLAMVQTAYPHAVREQARKMVRSANM